MAAVITPAFALTPDESKVIAKLPGALRELAEWHEIQATLADGMDIPECVDFHDARKKAVRLEANRIEKEMEG